MSGRIAVLMDPTETMPGFLRMDTDPPAHPTNTTEQGADPQPPNEHSETAQCRICLDGPDPELGRLIRPCLCRGSISVSLVYVVLIEDVVAE